MKEKETSGGMSATTVWHNKRDFGTEVHSKVRN